MRAHRHGPHQMPRPRCRRDTPEHGQKLFGSTVFCLHTGARASRLFLRALLASCTGPCAQPATAPGTQVCVGAESAGCDARKPHHAATKNPLQHYSPTRGASAFLAAHCMRGKGGGGACLQKWQEKHFLQSAGCTSLQ